MQREIIDAIESVQRSSDLQRPTNETINDQEGLDAIATNILALLARSSEDYPTIKEIASHLHLHTTKCEYYLDILMEKKMVNHSLFFDSPPQYYLTNAGRKYVVEHNLIQ